MRISIIALALVACYMSCGVDAQFGLGMAGIPIMNPLLLAARFRMGGLFGGFGGLGFGGLGGFGGGFGGFGGGFGGFGGIGGFGGFGRFRRFGGFGRGLRRRGGFIGGIRGKRSVAEIESDEAEIKEIQQEEIAEIAEIKKEIQTLAAFNRTICAFDFEESVIRCDRAERESFECEVEPRLDVVSEMTHISLPSLAMTQVPLAFGEKEIPAINLYSPVKLDCTMVVKDEKVVLSIYDKEDIKLPGWFVKDSKCFERLNGMLSSEVLTKVFPRFKIDWVREE